jgi:hypothetical protein
MTPYELQMLLQQGEMSDADPMEVEYGDELAFNPGKLKDLLKLLGKTAPQEATGLAGMVTKMAPAHRITGINPAALQATIDEAQPLNQYINRTQQKNQVRDLMNQGRITLDDIIASLSNQREAQVPLRPYTPKKKD